MRGDNDIAIALAATARPTLQLVAVWEAVITPLLSKGRPPMTGRCPVSPHTNGVLSAGRAASRACVILPGEVRDKKPSLTLNLGTNRLKVTSEPPPMAGQAGCLQGPDRSAVTNPSSSNARRRLMYCRFIIGRWLLNKRLKNMDDLYFFIERRKDLGRKFNDCFGKLADISCFTFKNDLT
ncbi:hypothetical protein J6590_031996 [Homalodisca vitripennis]|nr:hypothetical protein J6590_031996 [Homalodisca vitripennis]